MVIIGEVVGDGFVVVAGGFHDDVNVLAVFDTLAVYPIFQAFYAVLVVLELLIGRLAVY